MQTYVMSYFVIWLNEPVKIFYINLGEVYLCDSTDLFQKVWVNEKLIRTGSEYVHPECVFG